MMSQLPSRRLCPGRMESKASEGERRHRLTMSNPTGQGVLLQQV